MSKRSKAKTYSQAQLRGLKVIGLILREARNSEKHSYRTFAALVSNDNVSFNHTDIRRYENSGYVVDKRYGTIASPNPLYLEVVSNFIPYPLHLLKELADPGIDAPDPRELLSEMLKTKREKLGDIPYSRECHKWGLSEDELDQASRGVVTSPVILKLANLFGIAPEQICRAALADKARIIDEQAKETPVEEESELN